MRELTIYFIKVIGETKKKLKYIDTVYDTTYNIEKRDTYCQNGKNC